MTPGDVVNIPIGVKYWHGGNPDNWFSHLAVEVPVKNVSNEGMEAGTDEQYGIEQCHIINEVQLTVCAYGKSKLYFSNISLVGAESAPTFTIWGRKAPPEFKNGSILRPRFLKTGI